MSEGNSDPFRLSLDSEINLFVLVCVSRPPVPFQFLCDNAPYHNNEEIRHEDCLYDPHYSNPISGQRMGAHMLR